MEPNKFSLDESMASLYKGMFGIDPEECIPITEPVGNLAIKVEGRKIPFQDFLDKRITTVTLEQFSTKELNDEAILKSGMSETQSRLCMSLYMELQRVYGVIEYNSKNVGIANHVKVYNGFPNFIDSAEFIKNPQQVFQEQSQKALNDVLRTLGVKPQIYTDTFFGLHRDFLRENPVYDITKKPDLWSKFVSILRK